METTVLQIDALQPEADRIARAAEILRAGGLVAFPTETVYGLGALALNAEAVSKIFEAKGRPPNNPIIVHIDDPEKALNVVAAWSPAAQRLSEHFWPGPLTLVLPKHAAVPAIVTAGGPTVGVRMPAHPVALALIAAAGGPLAAPSANRSTELSPTRAEHVRKSMEGLIPIILDGGPAPGGIESTVLDLSTNPPRLLRPGLVSAEEIEAIVGPIQRMSQADPQCVLPSPGLLPRHYAPRTPLELSANGVARVRELLEGGKRVGWLTLNKSEASGGETIRMPATPREYAAALYAALHQLDERRLDRLVVDLPPQDAAWLAIYDRLRRAAT